MKNNKNGKSNSLIQIILLVILILITIVGLITSSFFITNAQWGPEIGNQYQVIINYKNASSIKEATSTLQAKMDPLFKKRIDMYYLGNEKLSITTSQGNYNGLNDFRRNVERRGAIFFFDENGNDLLLGVGQGKNYVPSSSKEAKRIPLKDFIDQKTIKFITTNTYNPAVEFKIKPFDVYEAILKYLNPNPNNNSQSMAPIYVWTDIGQLLDEMRSNPDDLFYLREYFKRQINDLENQKSNDEKIRDLRQSLSEFLTANLFDRNNNNLVSEIRFGDDSVNLALIREKFNNYDVTFQVVKNVEDLTIDVNDSEENYEKQRHLRLFRPYLAGLMKKFNEKNIEKYNKYLITSSPLQFDPSNKKNYVEVVRGGESIARSLAKIMIAGITGISYEVEWQGVIFGKGEQKSVYFTILMTLLVVVIVTILVYLSVVYRIWGVILSVVLTTIVISSMAIFNQLSTIYGWEIIAGLIIGLVLAFSSGIIFLERMKEELRTGKGLIQAFKDANRKSISTMFDIFVLVLIMSIFIFWLGTAIFKNFSMMIIISLIISAVLAVFLLRGVYYAIVHLNKSIHQSTFFFLTSVTNEVITSSGTSNFLIKKIRAPMQRYWKLIFLGFSSIIILIGMILFFTVREGTSLGFSRGIIFLSNISQNFSDNILREEAILKIKAEISEYFQEYYNWMQFSIDVLKNDQYEYVLLIKTSMTDINSINVQNIASFLDDSTKSMILSSTDVLNFNNQNTTNVILEGLMMLGVMLGVCLVYLMIRFDWTFSLPLVMTIIFDVLLVGSGLLISRLSLNLEVIIAILSVVIFSSIYKIIFFDRIRENKMDVNNSKIEKQDLSKITALSLKLIIKYNTSILIFTIMLLLPMFAILSLIGANFVIILGFILASISSTILLGWCWEWFANIKIKIQKKQRQKIYKNLEGIDEQKVAGVNS